MIAPLGDTRPMGPRPNGLIIAAPSSGSGKTLITLGLLRALNKAGFETAPAKTGPDYIDPAFLSAAAGRPAINLDPWGMGMATLNKSIELATADATPVLVEGVMGLFDGAADGTGSTADLAALTGWPVILVVDAKRQSGSVAALIHGFMTYRSDIHVAGIILNRVGSVRHRLIIEDAVETLSNAPTILGAIREEKDIAVPSRHLGLVQASEQKNLEHIIDTAASLVAKTIDLNLVKSMFAPVKGPTDESGKQPFFQPLGQKIAIAQDVAFAFAYDGLLQYWRTIGTEILPFSPLANEAPSRDADAIYLPGGYPELHAGKLAESSAFLDGLRQAASQNKPIYGECGGYMVLGDTLIDKSGTRHKMSGLLPVTTSFENPKRALGLRSAVLQSDCLVGKTGDRFRAHEFHYTSVVDNDKHPNAVALFTVSDAKGEDLGVVGHINGSVAGSFIHLIDRAP